MFEIAKKSNGKQLPLAGEFLFLAKNINFSYWVFGELKYSVNFESSKSCNSVIDNAVYKPYGIYDVVSDGASHTAYKKQMGNTISIGKKSTTEMFDYLGARKRAYGFSSEKLIGIVIGKESKTTTFVDVKPVKKYKKKK